MNSERALRLNSPAGAFCIPTTGTIEKRFGSGHGGIDIASGQPAGVTPVYAVYPGQVVYVGRADTGPDVRHAVAINHGKIGDKYILTLSVHMGHGSTGYASVNVGDNVQKGTEIGKQGDAGNATGVHLHFGVFERSEPFLDSYSSWGTRCQRSDLWYELGGGRGGECPSPFPEPGVAVNPESTAYLGSLTSPVTANCLNNVPPDTSITSGPSGTINTNSATFTWTGADDQTPTPNLQYSYKLDGYSDWSGWTGNTSVTYNNLPDRSYTFRVKARDQAGNEDPSPATRSFTVDTTSPNVPTISISGSGCAGIQNNGWQNTCNDPAFTWTAYDPNGIQGYHYCWSTNLNCSPAIWTTSASFDPPAIAPTGGVATYALNVRARDNLNNDSAISSFIVRYDGAPPTATLQINNGATTANQVNVTLNLSSGDTGSGVTEMCVSNSSTCSDWQAYADTIAWTLPALNRRTHTVHARVRDRAGNESALTSASIYLDLYPPMPHSANYRICADVVNAGGSVGITSTGYSLVSSIGQPWATGANDNTSTSFTGQVGFLSSLTGCLPISFTVTNDYTVTQWVVASGGNLRGSVSYRLGDTAGQPAASGGNTLTSASYKLSSGFWAQITGSVPPTSTVPPTPVPLTPTPTRIPAPTPTPQPGGFGVSINDGALYTNNPLVTVRLWAPNVTHMRLSNDGGYSDADWRAYQVTTTWLLSTYGNYVMPRYVYAWFRDTASGVYGPYFDDIVYDPTAPQGSVSILGGETMTVTLWLKAWDDNSGVSEMRLGHTPAITSAWRSYTNTLEWVLTGDVVYAQFRDRAGNESLIYGSDGSVYNPNAKHRIFLPVVLRQF